MKIDARMDKVKSCIDVLVSTDSKVIATRAIKNLCDCGFTKQHIETILQFRRCM